MDATAKQTEHHSTERLGWLRAAVLGANDGLLSTSSLIIGVDGDLDAEIAHLRDRVAPVLAGIRRVKAC